MGVCTTSYWKTSGRLVQELNVCTVEKLAGQPVDEYNYQEREGSISVWTLRLSGIFGVIFLLNDLKDWHRQRFCFIRSVRFPSRETQCTWGAFEL